MSASQPDDQTIRLRAYALWENDGRPFGHESAHWERARAALESERASGAARTVTPQCGPPQAHSFGDVLDGFTKTGTVLLGLAILTTQAALWGMARLGRTPSRDRHTDKI